MAKTRWTGGKSGTELMPEDVVSMYYADFNNVIPTMDILGANNNDGYHTGDDSLINEVPYGFWGNITPTCLVNGAPVSIEIISSNPTGKFKILSAIPGYANISYSPVSSSIYFSKVLQENYQIPVRSRLTKTRKEHIGEILNALTNICDTLQLPQRTYSIGEYTASPIRYNSAYGISSKTPITKQLMNEIREHVRYLNRYMITNAEISASIALSYIPSYNYTSISAFFLETVRSEINVIEGAIDLLGI